MSERNAQIEALGRLRWAGFGIRVEHLVAPGGWLTRRGTHLKSCNCRCSDVQTCPECKQPSRVASVSGRWDAENGYTARPFDPVWVRLACGCTFGDEQLSRPSRQEERVATDGPCRSPWCPHGYPSQSNCGLCSGVDG